jgi:hypothetical protein
VFAALALKEPTSGNLVDAGVIVFVIAAGLYLLVGYFHRMRSRPFRLGGPLLWQATVVFNMVGLIASVLLFWPLALFYLALIVLATLAYRAETRAF